MKVTEICTSVTSALMQSAMFSIVGAPKNASESTGDAFVLRGNTLAIEFIVVRLLPPIPNRHKSPFQPSVLCVPLRAQVILLREIIEFLDAERMILFAIITVRRPFRVKMFAVRVSEGPAHFTARFQKVITGNTIISVYIVCQPRSNRIAFQMRLPCIQFPLKAKRVDFVLFSTADITKTLIAAMLFTRRPRF